MFSTWGALIGLAIAIALIVRKATPAYALVLGALVGGLLGGGSLPETVSAMISGAQSMMPSVLRILTSGVLAGALVKTGSAEKIADAVIRALGSRFALTAIALATLIVTAVGVFVDIAVITVAPVALAIGRRAGIPIPRYSSRWWVVARRATLFRQTPTRLPRRMHLASISPRL
jgi:GntP family gluconate:H+ symporter